jgi:hypothetical protein
VPPPCAGGFLVLPGAWCCRVRTVLLAGITTWGTVMITDGGVLGSKWFHTVTLTASTAQTALIDGLRFRGGTVWGKWLWTTSNMSAWSVRFGFSTLNWQFPQATVDKEDGCPTEGTTTRCSLGAPTGAFAGEARPGSPTKAHRFGPPRRMASVRVVRGARPHRRVTIASVRLRRHLGRSQRSATISPFAPKASLNS